MRSEMTISQAIGAGAGGALALTLLNEAAHRLAPEAPRLDVLGMRAVVRGLRSAGAQPPRGPLVPLLALAGDLIVNGAFYGLLVGRRRQTALVRGVLAGAGAGAAAVALAPRFGLNATTGYHWGRRTAMFGLYALSGLCAGATAYLLAGRRRRRWHRVLGR
jgi:hypothetical protein